MWINIDVGDLRAEIKNQKSKNRWLTHLSIQAAVLLALCVGNDAASLQGVLSGLSLTPVSFLCISLGGYICNLPPREEQVICLSSILNNIFSRQDGVAYLWYESRRRPHCIRHLLSGIERLYFWKRYRLPPPGRCEKQRCERR